MEENVKENSDVVNAEIKAIKKANALESLGFDIEDVMANVKGKPLIDIIEEKIINTFDKSNQSVPSNLKKILIENPQGLLDSLSIIRDSLTSPSLKREYNILIYIVKNLDKILSLV